MFICVASVCSVCLIYRAKRLCWEGVVLVGDGGSSAYVRVCVCVCVCVSVCLCAYV